MSIVRDWNRLPKKLVCNPSLEMFKARFYGALNNLVWGKMSLPTSGLLD